MEESWLDHFVEHVSPYNGYVTEAEELDGLIQEFELSTHSSFVIRRTKKNFLKSPTLKELLNLGSIRWQDTQDNGKPTLHCDGVPFIIMGSRILDCRHGPERHKKQKEARRTAAQNEKETHNYTRKHRRNIQPTKKLQCEAKIYLRHIIKFPNYKCEEAIKGYKKREQVSAQVRRELQEGADVNCEHQFHILLPQSHSNHINSEECDAVMPIDKRLAQFIHQKVAEDAVYSSRELKLLLAEQLKSREDLFKNKPLPPRTNTRFWPTLDQIRNHMNLSLLRRRDSSMDQKCLDDLVQKWQSQQQQHDRFFLRAKSDENKFLYVHQTQWQQTLLGRYGQELCLLDATYRTSKYVLPLFFLAVPTNVNYMVVASFIVESETEEAIREALSQVRSWNPEWTPRFFMTDKSEEEMTAIETVFQDCQTEVYLCDFHRIQSWNRWLSSNIKEIQEEKDVLLNVMKDIASSSCEEMYDCNVSKLMATKTWVSSPKFRRWFANNWLNCCKKWVKMHRQHRFNVAINTTNGVERQNSTLKWGYLWAVGNQKTQTLSQLVHIMVNQWLPESYQRYVRLNAASSSNNRAYSEDVPPFLHNKPVHFVKHEMQRWHEAEQLTEGIEASSKDGTFFVNSATHPGRRYEVTFDDGNGYPDCQCMDWKRHHYPCKHMLAVISSSQFPRHNWESLPEMYRHNVFINLHVSTEAAQQTLQTSGRRTDADKDAGTNADSLQAVSESGDPIQPNSSKDKLSLMARRVRSTTKSISDLSHICTNVDIMSDVHTRLQELQRLLHDSCDHEGPFLKEQRPSVSITNHGSKLRLRRGSRRKIKRRSQSKAMASAVKGAGTIRCINLKKGFRSPNTMGRFTCDICNLSFIKRRDLIMHNTTCHSEAARSDDNFQAECAQQNMSRFKKMKAAAGNKKDSPVTNQGVSAPAEEVQAEENEICVVPPSSGLRNLGNTCFLNAVLQCLRQTSHLVGGLQSFHQNKSCECFTCKLKQVICQDQPVERSLLVGIKEKWSYFVIGAQQCAAEFFTKITEAIDAGTRKQHFGQGTASATFQSALEYQNTCRKCHWKLRPTLDECHQINLPVVPNANLSQILEEEFLCENLHGFKCRNSQCGAAEVDRHCRMTGPPKALVINLKRYRNDGSKVTDPVGLVESLDVPSDKQRMRYNLYGVVVYHGTEIKDGHYVAFVKKDGKWWEMNDHMVKPSRWEDVQKSCATLLFLAPTCIRRGKSCATEGACAGTDVESEERQIHTQVKKKEMNTQRPVQTRKRKLIPIKEDSAPCSRKRRVIDVSQRMLERLEKLMKEECDDESFTINGKVFHADQVKQKICKSLEEVAKMYMVHDKSADASNAIYGRHIDFLAGRKLREDRSLLMKFGTGVQHMVAYEAHKKLVRWLKEDRMTSVPQKVIEVPIFVEKRHLSRDEYFTKVVQDFIFRELQQLE